MLWLMLNACLYDVEYYHDALLLFKDNDQDRWSEAQGDCDDTNININPEADEHCNSKDDDCNGEVDDEALDTLVWYQDSDKDGFGLEATVRLQCSEPEGFTQDHTDCDDLDPEVNPEATEYCDDTRDIDCDGQPGNFDGDGDGTPKCSDCEDEDDDIHPGAAEVCDGEDNDCDGTVDGATAAEAQPWYEDYDHDGYGTGEAVVECEAPYSPGWSAESGDCDDESGDVNPGQDETCGNEIDDNCDGTASGCRLSGELEPDGAVVLGDSSYFMTGGPVGDVTGDSIDDFLVAAIEYNSQAGAVFVISGDSVSDHTFVGDYTLDAVAIYSITGPSIVESLGLDTRVIGDVDMDGTREWITWCRDVDTGNKVAYVFPEQDSSDIELAYDSRARILEQEPADLGYWQDSPGDISGDALPDLLATQAGNDEVASNGGVVRGYTSFDDDRTDFDADINLRGDTASLGFGTGVRGGDFNGDGIVDVLVGAAAFSDFMGATFLFEGPIPEDAMSSDADTIVTGMEQTDFYYGYTIETTEDANGDGLDDAWVAATGSNRQYPGAGEVFLLTDLATAGEATSVATASVSGEASNDYLSNYGFETDDMDGDGTPDLVIGTREQDQGGNAAGKLYILYGPFAGARSVSAADGWIVGHNDGGGVGTYITVPGDINGDGRLDILYNEQQTDVGSKVNILYGYDL